MGDGSRQTKASRAPKTTRPPWTARAGQCGCGARTPRPLTHAGLRATGVPRCRIVRCGSSRCARPCATQPSMGVGRAPPYELRVSAAKCWDALSEKRTTSAQPVKVNSVPPLRDQFEHRAAHAHHGHDGRGRPPCHADYAIDGESADLRESDGHSNEACARRGCRRPAAVQGVPPVDRCVPRRWTDGRPSCRANVD